MGWWSKDIMGGDTPLDLEGDIFDICEVEQFPDDGTEVHLSRQTINSKLKEIQAMLDKQDVEDRSIGYQVLAVLILEAGGKMIDQLKTTLIEAILTDPWAQEDPEREKKIYELIVAIQNSTGAPVKITSKGLFEVMAEKLGGGADN